MKRNEYNTEDDVLKLARSATYNAIVLQALGFIFIIDKRSVPADYMYPLARKLAK